MTDAIIDYEELGLKIGLENYTKRMRSAEPVAVVFQHNRFADLVIGTSKKVYYANRCVAFDTSDEQISKSTNEYIISLNALSDSKSLLVLNIAKIAQKQVNIIKDILLKSWNPTHEELLPENFPVYDYESYLSLKDHEKTLC